MAIPFNLPSDEETEENYRRLDQLLLDLYDIIRQILLRRRIQRAQGPEPQPQAAHHHNQQQHGRHCSHHGCTRRIIQESSRQQQHERQQQPQLPDLVQSSVARKAPVPPPRRRRRRDNKQQSQQLQQRGAAPVGESALADVPQGPNWLNVGIELRQIAEEFRSTQITGSEEKRRKEIKASSLFSLLVPAPLTGSIWTTVIILVGWRILARHR